MWAGISWVRLPIARRMAAVEAGGRPVTFRAPSPCHWGQGAGPGPHTHPGPGTVSLSAVLTVACGSGLFESSSSCPSRFFRTCRLSVGHDSSGILYTWMKMDKTVQTCLNMVQTCLYMFMHVRLFMNVYRHVHEYIEMYIACTYTFMIVYICIYMVHTRS